MGLERPRIAVRAWGMGCGGKTSSLAQLSGCPRVSVMQAANLWDSHDLTPTPRLHFSRDRRVAIEREMRPGSVVVFEVAGQDPNQVSLAEHDHVIQALAAD